jgi:hypothetical protein
MTKKAKLALVVGAFSLGVTGIVAVIVGVLSVFGVIVFVPVGGIQIIAAFGSLAGSRAARFVGLVSSLVTVALAQGGFESSNPLTVTLTAAQLIGSLVAFVGLLLAELQRENGGARSRGSN